MEYKTLKTTNKKASVKISRLIVNGKTAECHVIIGVNDPSLTLEEQLETVVQAYDEMRKTEVAGARTVFKRYFLSDPANQSDMVMNHELERADYAVSVVGQAPLNGTKVALWAWLMTSVETRALSSGLYEARQGAIRHLFMAGATSLAKDSERQMRLLFNEYVMQLAEEGCTLEANCLRTWLFVNDIDRNYAGVVKARNDVFYTQGLTDETHFIASTGIGCQSADPRKLTRMDAYAVEGIAKSQVKYLYATSHLNRTSDYGVSFERGTQVDYADRRHVFISGTASINNRGEIVYTGDVRSQCRRVWENVETLLAEAGCDFGDVTHMLVYLRDPADAAVIRKLYEERFADVPFVIVEAKVCRPGWLVEMEVMAEKALGR